MERKGKEKKQSTVVPHWEKCFFLPFFHISSLKRANFWLYFSLRTRKDILRTRPSQKPLCRGESDDEDDAHGVRKLESRGRQRSRIKGRRKNRGSAVSYLHVWNHNKKTQETGYGAILQMVTN